MDVWITIICLSFLAGNSIGEIYLQPQGDEHVYFTYDMFFITCLASGSDDIKDITWYGPSENSIKDTMGRIHIEEPPDTKADGSSSSLHGIVLVVENAQREDAGTYTCSAIVNGERETASFKLIVYGSISFEGTEPHQYGPEGSNMTVECNVDGDPKPSVKWYFRKEPLSKGEKYNTDDNILKVYNIKRENAGNYTCSAMIVTDHGSQIKETNITVHVQYAPEWIHENGKDSYSRIGHTANLTCEAKAEPAPSFEWKKNGETILTENEYSMFNTENKTVLQIFVQNSTMFGNYECHASNLLGSKKRDIHLREGDTPNPPIFKIISEDAGTLQLDISRPNSNILPVIGYKIEYRLVSQEWSDALTKEFDVDNQIPDQQYIVKNLNYNAEYVIRVSAKNAVGYGNYSEEIVRKTKSINSNSVSDNNNSQGTLSSAIETLLSTTVLLWVLRL